MSICYLVSRCRLNVKKVMIRRISTSSWFQSCRVAVESDIVDSLRICNDVVVLTPSVRPYCCIFSRGLCAFFCSVSLVEWIISNMVDWQKQCRCSTKHCRLMKITWRLWSLEAPCTCFHLVYSIWLACCWNDDLVNCKYAHLSLLASCHWRKLLVHIPATLSSSVIASWFTQ